MFQVLAGDAPYHQLKVVQLHEETADRPKAVAGVAWLAPGPAHYSPFLPVPSGFSWEGQTKGKCSCMVFKIFFVYLYICVYGFIS